MTPTIDYSPVVANTLAILQGRESLYTLRDELDPVLFEQAYEQAQQADNNHCFVAQVNGQYVICQKISLWTRRVR